MWTQNEILIPAIRQNRVVIMDRSIISAIVYSQSLGLNPSILKTLSSLVDTELSVFYINTAVDVAYSRKYKIDAFETGMTTITKRNFFEFQSIVRNNYSDFLDGSDFETEYIDNNEESNFDENFSKILRKIRTSIENN